MKKSELKKVLKPLVKECIREALFEEGILSNIISEVVHGLTAPIVEQKKDNENEIRKMQLEQKQERSQQINETRKKMLDAIGRSSYNGADLFEGTTPMSKAGIPGEGASPQSPLSGVDPNDAGIDISNLMGNFNTWKALAKGQKT